MEFIQRGHEESKLILCACAHSAGRSWAWGLDVWDLGLGGMGLGAWILGVWGYLEQSIDFS